MGANGSTVSFKSNQFEEVAYPFSLSERVSLAAVSWMSLRRLPEEVLQVFQYNDKIGFDGIGFERKSGDGPTSDRKDNFHFAMEHLSGLRESARAADRVEATQFLNVTEQLIPLIRQFLSAFAARLENNFHMCPGIRQEILDGEDRWIIRYLFYPPGCKVGEVIAKPHVDKSGLTLHLFESSPGLQRLTFRGDWIDLPIPQGATVIIPGLQMQFRSENFLKGLYHQVVATEEASANGRVSMVCFVPLVHTPKTDPAKVGRMQDRPPGFNYEMPYNELAGLFE